MLMKETDLFPPVADYLTTHGYLVRSEVRDCDVVALKNEELVVVELKKSFTVDLLVQATARQQFADVVYVAIPRPSKGLRGKHWQGIVRLAKRLELGLMLVITSGKRQGVEVAVAPCPYRAKRKTRVRKAILREVAGRSEDFNQGGSAGVKLLTAYRESAIRIAVYLQETGPLSAKKLRGFGTCDNTHSILYNNHYGWFSRVSPGVYGLSDLGLAELANYPELVALYKSNAPKLG